MAVPFEQVGRIPEPGDNVAIAGRRLNAGTEIIRDGATFTLGHTILEGHRFAITGINEREPLLSWGLPFGFATRSITAGDYICNAKILDALRQRHVDFALPGTPNFKDHLARYHLDEQTFKPGIQVSRHPELRYFQGFARGRRGVGTRNFVILLGTSSLTGSFVRQLAERFRDVPGRFANIDGVVAIAHTEGGGASRPSNFDWVVRTLAGFCVNPNVAAVLAVDVGTEPVNNESLLAYWQAHDYPIADLPHHLMSVRGHPVAALNEAEKIVRSWLPAANQHQRSAQSIEHLKIALQCGGSDAFSGVSGNPLAGWVAKEVVRYGGSANLAETDELIGAEPYVLRNVRDLATARAFLSTLERFQERVAWHGHSAEGNPSGGNNYRGLYNIAIKSIGAARKKDPEVRLDYVIEYGDPMPAPGFYFMDSPGNDLESIAGQMASGCNVILFTTGNGSITNFPFVPTIKIMTNTGRFEMLSKEMDVNAGRYQDGTPMNVLGAETFELTLRIASGERSAGERAGHSQVQLWREWRQTKPGNVESILNAPRPDGEPLALKKNPSDPAPRDIRFPVTQRDQRFASDRVGLIVPTSLCSGQIAKMIADKLNRQAPDSGLRYVALAHTEGCGASGGESERLYMRTMAGYLMHPFVEGALLLEHGCERTHNDAMRNFLEEHALDGNRFGWASVQLDGGIEAVSAKVIQWFQVRASGDQIPIKKTVGLEALRLGLTAVGPIPQPSLAAFSLLVRQLTSAGATVVIAQNATPLLENLFREELSGEPMLRGAGKLREPAGKNACATDRPSLAYGERFQKRGLHVMETPTDHHVETLTGLGATGVEIILAHVADSPLQGHPMVPLLQVGSASASRPADVSEGLDWILEPDRSSPSVMADQLLTRIHQVLVHEYAPKGFAEGNVDFQMTRGLLGVSL